MSNFKYQHQDLCQGIFEILDSGRTKKSKYITESDIFILIVLSTSHHHYYVLIILNLKTGDYQCYDHTL